MVHFFLWYITLREKPATTEEYEDRFGVKAYVFQTVPFEQCID